MSGIFYNPLVSVILPIYNVEDFLSEAIQSVLDQSLTDIEVILVNDGSTDRSSIICENFQQKDARVKFISQKNSGVSVARNNGLHLAKGIYVFFMDSDDTLDKEFLSTSYNVAQRAKSDIILVGEYFLRRLPRVHSLPTCAQMIKTDFLRQYPEIRFPANIQPCEDGLFSHQLLALTNNIAANPAGVYYYRQHENQNHTKINENVASVLDQIPNWFHILELFYTKHQLFQSHALHLALFMEHEPFELRYIAMPLNKEQKTYLHFLIKQFVHKNIFPYLHKTDKKHLSKPFLYFVECNEQADFDTFYIDYKSRLKKQKKIYLLLTKLVFINKIKQKLRKKIREKFEE